MTNASHNKWVDYSIFGLSLFLIFCLIFESYIELPQLVAWLGRWHPLVLHFPIVLLLLCIFLGLSGKNIPKLLFTFAVIFALVTAILGFFLVKASGTKGDLLFWHQWLGGTLAILAAIWYWFESMNFGKPFFSKVIQLVLLGLIFFTGHYGGMVTHGEDFLALPVEKREEKIPENPTVYKDIVGRILDEKCVSCHNPNKKKGELLMTSLSGLLEGGELGNTIIPGNYQESELIRRVHLPIEDEEHMPPEGKKPLTDSEIEIIERWIALGASDTLKFEHLKPSEPLVGLIKDLMIPNPMENWKKLPKVEDTTLHRLSSDYLTIRRIASGANAVSVNAYKSPTYNAKELTRLQPIAKQIVQLDVSGLPISQEEMNFIASCVNLEWLEIDQTPISSNELDTLKVLSKLKKLKIFSTSLGDESIPILKKIEGLNELYLWNTSISKAGLSELQKDNESLFIHSGISEDLKTSFATSDSIKKN